MSRGAEVLADLRLFGELVQVPKDLAGVPHIIVHFDFIEILIARLNFVLNINTKIIQNHVKNKRFIKIKFASHYHFSLFLSISLSYVFELNYI